MTNPEAPPRDHKPTKVDSPKNTLPDFINDGFSRARPGGSELLSVSCSSCNQPIMVYQKDGGGPLIRCYLDRIYLPDNPEQPLDPSGFAGTSDIKPLTCTSCHAVVGVPMLYKKERRFAYRVIPGSVKKKRVK